MAHGSRRGRSGRRGRSVSMGIHTSDFKISSDGFSDTRSDQYSTKNKPESYGYTDTHNSSYDDSSSDHSSSDHYQKRDSSYPSSMKSTKDYDYHGPYSKRNPIKDEINNRYQTTESVNELNFNIDEVRKVLTRLVPLKDREPRSLTGKDADDFRKIVEYVRVLYGDNESYRVLYNEVQNIFGDLKSAQPGTVGGYFIGCRLSSKFDGKLGCSPTCAGAMKPPSSGDNSIFCDRTVIVATYNGSGYNFTVLEESPNKEELILFINASGSFPGFSDKERKTLENYGAKRIRAVRRNNDGTYEELTQGFVSLQETPARINVTDTNTPNTTNKNNLWTSVLVIIILLLIVGFIAWCLTSKNKNSK